MSHSTRSGYSVLWIILLASLTALGPLSIDMYLPAFPVMAADLNTSIKHISNSLPAFFAGLVIGQLIYGPISDAIGRKKPLYIGLMVFIVASFLCAFVKNDNILILLRFFQALGGSVGVVMARAAIRDKLDIQQASQALASMMIVMGIAPIIAPVIGSYILMISFWQMIFILLGIIGCINLFFIHFYFQDTLPDRLRQTIRFSHAIENYKLILQDKNFSYACLICFLSGTAMFTYINAASAIFMDYFKLSEKHFSYFFALNSLGIILVSYTGKSLSHYLTVLQKLLLGIICQVCGAGLLTLSQILQFNHMSISVIGLFLVVSAVGLTTPNATAIAMSNQAMRAGAASAVIGACHFSGGIISGFILFILNFNILINATIIMISASCLSLLVYLTGRYSGKLYIS